MISLNSSGWKEKTKTEVIPFLTKIYNESEMTEEQKNGLLLFAVSQNMPLQELLFNPVMASVIIILCSGVFRTHTESFGTQYNLFILLLRFSCISVLLTRGFKAKTVT